MSGCPDLAVLEAGVRSVEVDQHVDTCAACQFMLQLIDDRGEAAPDPCSQFEVLLAARAAGSLDPVASKLLARHLARCATCRAVADTLAPPADAAGDLLALPEVDPACYELGLELARQHPGLERREVGAPGHGARSCSAR